MNVFDENSLENPQSREEDEELEEQKRRQAELADLLATGIHAFNYDESTMNSSVTSTEDAILSTNYKNVDQQDQLKLLYEVRVREIQNLTEEFNKYKTEKNEEIKILKNKLTLSEAEIRHLQINLTNCESLLIEKSEAINNLKQNEAIYLKEIENLKKIIEEQNFEISTYKSTVTELEFKLSDSNPFNVNNRKLQSEEAQKAHQEQINRLETLLQEQTKKVSILEKEKSQLEADVKKLIESQKEIEEENNLTIVGLSKKLQNTQQQCKDLFVLGEAIKKESDHFKERLQQIETTNKLDISPKKWDKETALVQMEKLKRMMVDKDAELNTLKAKLKFYDSDLSELFEYRKILNKMYSKVTVCNNADHAELILFMQGQLQTYQQAIEDRNNQIITLNSVNKELEEKIEEMLQQTRSDIQNISQKYSLPQLETMNNELKNAENTINLLKKELEEKTEELKKNENIKKTLIEENDKVKTQLQKICLKLGLSEAEIFDSDEFESVEQKYGKIHVQLQEIFKHLENMNEKRANYNIIFNLKKQIENCLQNNEIDEKIEQWDNLLSDFIESLKHSDNFKHFEDIVNNKISLENEKKTLEIELEKKQKEIDEKNQEFEKYLENNDIQAKILQAEILLRDRLQTEYEKKIEKIENQYKTVINDNLIKEKDKWKKLEANYRKQFAGILEECGQKMKNLENENDELIKRINGMIQEYKNFKTNAMKYINDYNKIMEQWKILLTYYLSNASKIEKNCKKNTKIIDKKIQNCDKEVKLIEMIFDEKIKKLKEHQLNKNK